LRIQSHSSVLYLLMQLIRMIITKFEMVSKFLA
jgi:hypothetical protein